MNLEDLFKKVCLNSFPAIDKYKTDEGYVQKPVYYAMGNLSLWSYEAFAKGEEYFYVDYDKNGKLMLAEPRYGYKLKNKFLTEEEYKELLASVSK